MKLVQMVLTTLALALSLCAFGMAATLHRRAARSENETIEAVVKRAEQWLQLDHNQTIRGIDLEILSRLDAQENRLRALEGLPPRPRQPFDRPE